MDTNWQGIGRIRHQAPMEDDVIIEDTDSGTPGERNKITIPRSVYVERGYLPPLDDLPWK